MGGNQYFIRETFYSAGTSTKGKYRDAIALGSSLPQGILQP